MNKKLNKQNGITLIALIITIIVMLILVGVTISMAVNGGLFNYAGKASKDTQNAIDVEQELSSGKIKVEDKWYASIDEYLKGQAMPPAYSEAEFDGEYLVEKAAYTDSKEKKAIIPVGYKIENEGEKIENGLVIKDSNGNEFVWIPVEKAIITADEIATLKTEYNVTTDTEAIKALANDKGIFPMAVEVVEEENGSEVTNYKGILYEFEGTTKLTVSEVYNWTDSSEQIEPANVSKDNTTRLGSTWNDKTFQNEYNTMIKSVKDNGGFYVGRYEMSEGSYDDGTKYAQSKGETETTPWINWFYMYKCEKNYAECNSNLGVISEMIWGSQWDQMMVFVNGKNDGRTIPQSFYITECGSRAQRNDIDIGVNEADRVANIFDLEALCNEWTQEAISTTGRTYRGGNKYSPNKASARRTYMEDPTISSGDYFGSSRIALYIK